MYISDIILGLWLMYDLIRHEQIQSQTTIYLKDIGPGLFQGWYIFGRPPMRHLFLPCMVRNIYRTTIAIIIPSNVHVLSYIAITKCIDKFGNILLNQVDIDTISKPIIECFIFHGIRIDIVVVVVYVRTWILWCTFKLMDGW